MSQLETLSTRKKRTRSEEDEKDTRPGKTSKKMDAEDWKENIVKCFEAIKVAGARSKQNEKKLDQHDERLTRIEKHLQDNSQSKGNQEKIIAEAVSKAMKKNQKNAKEAAVYRQEL